MENFFLPDQKELFNKKELEEIKLKIKNRILSPFYKGTSECNLSNNLPCSICYLFFPRINLLKCCKNILCSNCYLTIQKNCCPFCRNKNNVIEKVIHWEEYKEKLDLTYKLNKTPSDLITISKKYKLNLEITKDLIENNYQIYELKGDAIH